MSTFTSQPTHESRPQFHEKPAYLKMAELSETGFSAVVSELKRQRKFASQCMLAASIALFTGLLLFPPGVAGSYGLSMLKISVLAFGASFLFGIYSTTSHFLSRGGDRDRVLLAAIRFEAETDFQRENERLGRTRASKRRAEDAFAALQGSDAFFFQTASFAAGLLIQTIFFLVK